MILVAVIPLIIIVLVIVEAEVTMMEKPRHIQWRFPVCLLATRDQEKVTNINYNIKFYYVLILFVLTRRKILKLLFYLFLTTHQVCF